MNTIIHNGTTYAIEVEGNDLQLQASGVDNFILVDGYTRYERAYGVGGLVEGYSDFLESDVYYLCQPDDRSIKEFVQENISKFTILEP